MLEKEALQRQINIILAEDESIDFTGSFYLTREDLYFNLIRELNIWYLYIYQYEQEEDYLFCLEIKRAIDKIVQKHNNLLYYYYGLTQEDKVFVKFINSELRKFFLWE